MISGHPSEIIVSPRVTNAGISMHYTSNERHYFTLSTDVSSSENRYEIGKWYTKKYALCYHFSIVHI